MEQSDSVGHVTPQIPLINQQTRVIGRRFQALFIDTFLLVALGSVLRNIGSNESGLILNSRFLAFLTASFSVQQISFAIMDIFLLIGCYFCFCEWLFGGTPGKLWSGIRVVTLAGHPITIQQAAIRTLLRPVDFFLGIGFFSVVVTPAHQRWGDRAANTVVTGIEYLPSPTSPIDQQTRMLWPRLQALFIDSIILAFLGSLLQSIGASTGGLLPKKDFSLLTATFPHSQINIAIAGGTLLIGCYYFFCEWLFGGTPGKMWSRIRVVTLEGQPITIQQAAIRTLLRPIDYSLFIGLFSARYTPAHQRLGDRLANTIVTGIEYLPAPLYTRQQRLYGILLITAVVITYLATGLLILNGYHF